MKTLVAPFPLSLTALEVFRAARVRLRELWVSLVRRMVPPASRPAERRLRLQIDFSPLATTELDELKGLMGAASRADVCKQALEWTNWVARQQVEGCRFIVVRRTGREELIILPWKRGGEPADGD